MAVADVFVSYQKRDRALAQRVVAELARSGYSVWWDDRLTPAESWDRLIEREIGQAKCVLVLWTEHSVASDWVRIEANFAKDSRPSKLVQARFDACSIPMAYSLLQHTDVSLREFHGDEGWWKVIEWVGMFAGPPKAHAEVAAHTAAAAQPTAHVTTEVAPADRVSFYLWGLIVALVVALVWSPVTPLMSQAALSEEHAWIWWLLPVIGRTLLFSALAIVLVRFGRAAPRSALLLVLVATPMALLLLATVRLGLPYLRQMQVEQNFTSQQVSLIMSLVSTTVIVVCYWLIGVLLGAFKSRRGLTAPIILTVACYILPVFLTLAQWSWSNDAPFWMLVVGMGVPSVLGTLTGTALLLSLVEPHRVGRA